MEYNLNCLDEQNTEALCVNEAAVNHFSQSDIVGKAPSMCGLASSAVRLGNGSAHGGHFALGNEYIGKQRKGNSRSGVYVLINIINGHFYVGSAVNLATRKIRHISPLRKGKHPNRHLQRAYDKYGEDAFDFKILIYCEPIFLIQLEQFFIDTLHPEYNILPVAGSRLGFSVSKETRRKISASHKGRVLSEEHKRKIGEGLKGHIVSEDSRKKSSARFIGKPLSEEHRKKLSSSHKGKVLTEEQKRKIGLASIGNTYRLGHPLSEEHNRKLHEANKGNTYTLGYRHSDEAKAKIGAAFRGKTLSDEHKQKLKAAWVERRRRKAEKEAAYEQ